MILSKKEVLVLKRDIADIIAEERSDTRKSLTALDTRVSSLEAQVATLKEQNASLVDALSVFVSFSQQGTSKLAPATEVIPGLQYAKFPVLEEKNEADSSGE